jgi:hypothetical protein
MAIIYQYKASTREFIHTKEARPDPRNKGEFLMPKHSTLIAPPTVAVNEAAVFDGSAWSVVIDHRGTEYWLENGEYYIIKDLGVAPPAGSLPSEPPPVPVPDPTPEEIIKRNPAVEALIQVLTEDDPTIEDRVKALLTE